MAGEYELEELNLEDESTYSSSQDMPCGVVAHTPCYDLTVKGQKRHVGRREADITKVLGELRTKNNKPLKKEYVRCQIIRGIKKCVRYLCKGRKPQKGIHQFDLDDMEKSGIWQSMKEIVGSKRELFEMIGATCEGPATDGKVIRKRDRLDVPEFRSFNDDYCRRFYSSEEVRQFHFHYLQLVYGVSGIDVNDVSRRLSVSCCSGCHTVHCVNVWEQVRHYVMFGMLEQLGIEPYRCDDNFDVSMTGYEDEFEMLDPDSLLA